MAENTADKFNLTFIIDVLHASSESYAANKTDNAIIYNPKFIEFIERIEAPSALYLFIPFMFSKHPVIAKLATNKAQALFNEIPLKQLQHFDETIRRCLFPYYAQEKPDYCWPDMSSSDSFTQDDLNGFYFMLQVLCCHPNGYVRYEAIERLTGANIAAAIPILLIRANDWVREIRILCHSQIKNILTTKDMKHLINYFPLIKQLKAKARYNQADLTATIEAALVNNHRKALLSIASGSNILDARYAFTLLAEHDAESDALLTATLNYKDIVIRIYALKLAEKYYNDSDFFSYLNHIKNDKLMVIRRNALYCFIKHYPQQSKKILKDALFDKKFSIRSLSRYYLSKMGVGDLSRYYKKALIEESGNTKINILGLSETGTKDDYTLIASLSSNKIQKLESTMISAAFNMKPNNWKNIIGDLSANHSPAILKALAKGVKHNQPDFSFQELIDLVYRKNDSLSIRYFLKINADRQYDRWLMLDFLLNELIKILNQETVDMLKAYLSNWVDHNSPNKIFSRQPNQIIKKCLEKTEKLLTLYPNDSTYVALLHNIKFFS